MVVKINGNKVPAPYLEGRLKDYVPENAEFAVTGVRTRYHYDEHKRKTDAVEAVVYDVLEMETLAALSIRVNTTIPVITQEKLMQSEGRVFILFPLEETVVRPYRLEYGTATVSIVAPYAKLVTPADSVED